MTLQEAIKSGKRFRPVNWDDEFFDYRHWNEWFDYFVDMASEVTSKFILEDFEIEEKKVEITESQLREAFEIGADGGEIFLDALARELGLK